MKNWVERDLKHIWHPYTQMKDRRTSPPVFIDKAKGVKLYDDMGNFYYDTISSWWCNVHGHNHPGIKKAIRKQLDLLEHVLFAGFTHEPAIRLAEEIIAIAPRNLKKVFFSDNGSTAVETALKMSFQYWQNIGKKRKKKFVSLDRGYHGDTIGAMSVSGVGLFNSIFKDLLFPSFKVPAPYCYRCPVGAASPSSCSLECAKPLETILKSKNSEIAALIMEPLIMAAGGMIVYPKSYLSEAARLARKYGVHLIVDEVATGFGRTGKMFACDHTKTIPDFMCLSKGVTAGYLPLGVTLTSDDIYNAFYGSDRAKTFYHGHTFTANPISCAAALASLDIFKKEDTLEHVKDLMPIFHERLEGFREIPIVGDVRYIGMIGAVELIKDKKTKEIYSLKGQVGRKLYKAGLERNIILRPLGNVVYLFLPLCVTKRELEDILDRTYGVIEQFAQELLQ